METHEAGWQGRRRFVAFSQSWNGTDYAPDGGSGSADDESNGPGETPAAAAEPTVATVVVNRGGQNTIGSPTPAVEFVLAHPDLPASTPGSSCELWPNPRYPSAASVVILSPTAVAYFQSYQPPELAAFDIREWTERDQALEDLKTAERYVNTAGTYAVDSAERRRFWSDMAKLLTWLEEVFNNREPFLERYDPATRTLVRIKAFLVWSRSLKHPRRRLKIIEAVYQRMLPELLERAHAKAWGGGPLDAAIEAALAEALGDQGFVLLLPEGANLADHDLINAVLHELEADIAVKKHYNLTEAEKRARDFPPNIDAIPPLDRDNPLQPRRPPLPLTDLAAAAGGGDESDGSGEESGGDRTSLALAMHGLFVADFAERLADMAECQWLLRWLASVVEVAECHAVRALAIKRDGGPSLGNADHQALSRLRHRLPQLPDDALDAAGRGAMETLTRRFPRFRQRRTAYRWSQGAQMRVGDDVLVGEVPAFRHKRRTPTLPVEHALACAPAPVSVNAVQS